MDNVLTWAYCIFFHSLMILLKSFTIKYSIQTNGDFLFIQMIKDNMWENHIITNFNVLFFVTLYGFLFNDFHLWLVFFRYHYQTRLNLPSHRSTKPHLSEKIFVLVILYKYAFCIFRYVTEIIRTWSFSKTVIHFTLK